MTHSLRSKTDIESAVHLLSLPLYQMVESIRDQAPVPSARMREAVAVAMPWHKLPDIIWVYDADLVLAKGESTLGEALKTHFGQLIDDGLFKACLPGRGFQLAICVAVCLMTGIGWFLGHPGAGCIFAGLFGLVMVIACIQLANERAEEVKATAARMLYPFTQVCDRVCQGVIPLPPPFEASRGHILATYMWLRLAGEDRQAELLLPLFELGLLGSHVIGFDAEGRVFVSVALMDQTEPVVPGLGQHEVAP